MNIRNIILSAGRPSRTACDRAPDCGGVAAHALRSLVIALVFAPVMIGRLAAAELNPVVPGAGLDADYYAFSVPRFDEIGRMAVYRNTSAIVLQDRATRISRRLTMPVVSGGASLLGWPDIDLNGRRIIFEYGGSTTATPPPPDEFRPYGIYLHDLVSGDTTHVSRAPSGSPIVDVSQSRLSGNGQFITFVSADADLVPDDTNGQADVFAMRLSDGVISRVSVSSSGMQAVTGSSSPTIDANGTRIAFSSADAGLVSGDTNGVEDVFVHDLSTGATRRVSVASDGAQADGPSTYPDISDEGNDVAFVSSATNLGGTDTLGGRNVYLHALSGGVTVLASPIQDSSTPEGSVGAKRASISADGQRVAFGYSLYPNDTAETGDDNVTHVFDRAGNQVARLRGGRHHYGESISPDGSTVGFSEEYDYLRDQGGPPRAYAVDTRPFCDVDDASLQFTLAQDHWTTLSMPCEMTAGTTMSDVFADDMSGIYGSDWVVFVFDDSQGRAGYRTMALDDRLKPGQGFWILSTQGGSRTLRMPPGSRSLEISSFADVNCIAPSGCQETQLRDGGAFDGGWNLIGTASARSPGVAVSDFRFVTDAGTCGGSGCTYTEASDDAIDLVAPVLWIYDGTRYELLETDDVLSPWHGFWTKTSRTAVGTDLRLRTPGGTGRFGRGS